MVIETRDVIQFAVILCGAAATIAVLKNETKHQTRQHLDLKETTDSQFMKLGNQISTINESIMSVSGNSREHSARISNLEGRVERAEGHIDQIGRDIGVGRRIS